MRICDLIHKRLEVIGQLRVPAISVPPSGSLCAELRQHAAGLALQELADRVRDLLIFFLCGASFDPDRIGLVMMASALRSVIRIHVRVLRRSLTALDHVQRNDQLVTAIDRRQIIVSPCFVPGHPRTSDGCLNDRSTLLKGSLDLLGHIKLDVSIRISADLRQQEAVDPLLQHLKDRT